MRLYQFNREQILPISVAEAWDFFSRPSNLEAITPPELGFESVYQSHESLVPGMLIVHRIQLAPLIKINWISEIRYLEEQHSFVDEQRSGPYAFWQHRHSFEEHPDGTLMRDEVNYALPMGIFGAWAEPLIVRPQLRKIFKFRFDTIENYFKGRKAS